MSTLREQVIQNHILENMPNARIVDHNDADSGLKFYTEAELHNLDADWFPLSCQIDPATGLLRYGGRGKVTHTYTEGETGAGKTTRFAIQSLRALSSMKNKPSFLVVDIHGEIIENLYTHLINQGYAVKILNCDDPAHSDTYNPFASLVKQCQQTGQLDNDCYNRLRRIAEIIQPVNSSQDPIWDQGARSYTNGAILDKFEDLIAGDIPAECVTLYNIIENHYWLRDELGGSYSSVGLFSLPHYKKKGTACLSAQKMMSVTNNAEKTKASYFGVVENHYDAFGQPSMYQLSSSSTIDVLDFIERPTAIIIQSGNTRVGDDLISLMVNDIYTTVVRMGKLSATKMLKRKIHCFLDEFANSNIADGADFIKMLTTSRKFGMYWHMLLQCDAQLETKFNPTTARIIRANCTELFMGSQDYDTIVRFARSCGQKTVESLESVISQRYATLQTVDLITPDRLSLTEEGHIYVKSSRNPLLHTYFESFYNCAEYESVEDLASVYPVNDFDYRQTRFLPCDIPAQLTRRQFHLVEYLHEYRTCTEAELDMAMGAPDLRRILQTLQYEKIIKKSGGVYTLNLTENQYRLLAQRPYNEEEEEEAAPSVPPAPAAPPAPPRPAASRPNRVVASDKSIQKNGDAQFESELNPPSTIVTSLTEHYSKVNTDVDEKLLAQFTCIPETLRRAMLELQKHEPISEPGELPGNATLMKFEILEAYIGAHNFVTKRRWVDVLQREIKSLKRTNWLPESLLVPFDNAYHELDTELTLSNIKEIRRIINGDLDEPDEGDSSTDTE